MEINGINPIKYIVIAQKEVMLKQEMTTLITLNWIYEDIPPASFEYQHKEKFFDNTNNRVPFFTHGSGGSTTTDFSLLNLKNNIIDKATLLFNGSNRFSEIITIFRISTTYSTF